MRILLVEDEHRIAQTIKKGLEQERYAVDISYTGTEGYDLASSEEYDLIILDRMLPELDGIEVCRKLRDNSIHTPILMLTAKSQTIDKVEGLDSGADDYVSKPFSFEELLARIRALIRRPKKTIGTVLKYADICLNPQTFTVKRGENTIQLSHKEFSILEFLMRNSKKIVSKQKLIDHVWDFDADILMNTIEVNIKNLRDKIEKPFHKLPKLIHTIRGFGYKLE